MIFTYSSSNLFIRKQYITPFSFCKRDIFHSRGLLFSFDWSITRSLCFVNDLVMFFQYRLVFQRKRCENRKLRHNALKKATYGCESCYRRMVDFLYRASYNRNVISLIRR